VQSHKFTTDREVENAIENDDKKTYKQSAVTIQTRPYAMLIAYIPIMCNCVS